MRGDLPNNQRGDAVCPSLKEGVISGCVEGLTEGGVCERGGPKSARSGPRARVIRIGSLLQAAKLRDAEGKFDGCEKGHPRGRSSRRLEHSTGKNGPRCRVSEGYAGESAHRAPDECGSRRQGLRALGGRAHYHVGWGGEVHRRGEQHRSRCILPDHEGQIKRGRDDASAEVGDQAHGSRSRRGCR